MESSILPCANLRFLVMLSIREKLELEADKILEWIFSVYSIAVTALFNPKLTVNRLWPYVGMMFTFVAFIVWNGGVVLGK